MELLGALRITYDISYRGYNWQLIEQSYDFGKTWSRSHLYSENSLLIGYAAAYGNNLKKLPFKKLINK